MSIESNIFKRYTPDFKKAARYGFLENSDKYVFEKLFMNNEFKAIIEISKTGEVYGTVYDLANNDEYLPLRVESQNGAFVGEVRTEYKKILDDICKNCFIENHFIFPQSNRIANSILQEYGDNPEFLWEKFPGYGVFKNRDNNKWYGAIMNIDYSKLDSTKEGEVEIIDIKLDENKIQDLLKKEGFYPAWHMNKRSWITIILDETLSDDKIMEYIQESHNYTIDKQKRMSGSKKSQIFLH